MQVKFFFDHNEEMFTVTTNSLLKRIDFHGRYNQV
jgi:hypothetical protein